jgi:hypothetical protein
VLDDKKLLDVFKFEINQAVCKKEFAKEFIFNLLKCKFLFDKYIIKREFSAGTDRWALKCFKHYRQGKVQNGIQYKNTFGDDDAVNFDSDNRKILMLLAMFHVSIPSMAYKYWLHASLNYLFHQLDISSKHYISYLEHIVKSFVYDRHLAKVPLDYPQMIFENQNTIIRINDDFSKIKDVFSSFDQISGLSFKKKYFKINFGDDHWISHAYPFVDIFTRYPLVYLKDYILAVRIGSSGTRTNIYQKSPMINWINMINSTITDKKLSSIKQKLISDFIATNFIGLIQIKNYGNTKSLYREIWYLLKYNYKNIYNYKFWTFVVFVIFTPKIISRKLTDWYKENINSKLIKSTSFQKNFY